MSTLSRFSNLFLPEEYKQIPFNKADWDAGINRCSMILDLKEEKIKIYMQKSTVIKLLGKPTMEGVGCLAYNSSGECFESYITKSYLPSYLRICFNGSHVSSEPEFVTIVPKQTKDDVACSFLSKEGCEKYKLNNNKK